MRDGRKSEKKKSTCTKQEYIVSSFHGSEKYANLDLAALSVHEHMHAYTLDCSFSSSLTTIT